MTTSAFTVVRDKPYEVVAVDYLRGEHDGLVEALLVRNDGHELFRTLVLAEDVLVHPHPMVALGSALIHAAYKGEPNG